MRIKKGRARAQASAPQPQPSCQRLLSGAPADGTSCSEPWFSSITFLQQLLKLCAEATGMHVNK